MADIGWHVGSPLRQHSTVIPDPDVSIRLRVECNHEL
jgi:hypothetical protein